MATSPEIRALVDGISGQTATDLRKIVASVPKDLSYVIPNTRGFDQTAKRDSVTSLHCMTSTSKEQLELRLLMQTALSEVLQ